MKYLLTTALLAAATLSLPTACTPYPEEPPPVPGPDVARNQPQKTEAELKAEAEKKRMEEMNSMSGGTGGTENERPTITENIDDPTPATPDPKPSTPVARPVPGKPGFVFSPFNNKIIDVKDIPSGTLVADPTYPASEKKYFRVP